MLHLVRDRFWRRLKIGDKLMLGFAPLVLLTLAVILVSFLGSAKATQTIDNTDDVRVPAALASSHAQANLLRMFAAVRGYLALGDPQFQEDYEAVKHEFETDLADLEQLSHNFDPANQHRLSQLQTAFAEWSKIPEELFDLHDDRIDRNSAYALLSTRGTRLAGEVLIDMGELIEQRADAPPSTVNNQILQDMAEFQNSFAAILFALRGYVTTGNYEFRSYEYEKNLFLSDQAWETIIEEHMQHLDAEQRTALVKIDRKRRQFLEQIPNQVFTHMESGEWRRDLQLFNTELEPLTDEMQILLHDMTERQQQALQHDLEHGNDSLQTARVRTLAIGITAVIVGISLSLLFRQIIAGPVRRLTMVAEQIRAGDLTIMAHVESGDEIGVFAETFNSMTAKLCETLFQIRKEKKRADDLLHVVIPIGVALSSEKDFDQLLERILVEAMEFCHVDGGILFLREDDMLKFVMIRVKSRNIKMGGTSGLPIPFLPLPLYHDTMREPVYSHPAVYATLKGISVNNPCVYGSSSYVDECNAGVKFIDTQLGYHTCSVLDIPLKNNRNEVLGVLELMNAQDAETGESIAFDTNLQQMMESFSSLAVAALEAYIREQTLRQKVQELRIDIDETRRQQYVSEIVNNEFFQELWVKARSLRSRTIEEPVSHDS